MVWSDQFICSRGLREICRKKIFEEILIPLKIEKEFKLLIVDDFALKILTYCFKTEEMFAFNIALFDYLDEIREPVPYLSAVYLFFPSSQNIEFLLNDFVSCPPKYLNVHLFCLSDVKQEYFDEIVNSSSAGFVRTFKEIDILFVPYESQVFTLNDEKFLPVFLDAYKEMDLEKCAFVAKKLATLCTALKVFPRIRYRREHINNMLLAVALERELRLYHESFPPSHIQSDSTKPSVEILIIDRGFDCVTPLVHEYTFQATAHDLLVIEDDVFEYLEDQSNLSKISLIEQDLLWCILRHKYIVDVPKLVDEIIETHGLLRRYRKRNLARFKTLPKLGDAIRQKVAYRKNLPHDKYRRMANECIRLHRNGVSEVADIMQDLALGTISENTFSQDVRSAVLNILRSSEYDLSEKLRLLLLYIFYVKGITKSEFEDIIASSELPFEASVVTNILHLDVDIFCPGKCQAVDHIPRDDADASTSPLPLSNYWMPAIKNVMLSCIDGTLSTDKYPYLHREDCVTHSEITDKSADQISSLIVFIAGGVTYSEMRCAYEVMSVHEGCEVYIGGDSMLTPKKFLKKLGELSCLISKYT